MTDEHSDELDLSDPFFDFDSSVSSPTEFVMVQAIEKPEGVDNSRRGSRPTNRLIT